MAQISKGDTFTNGEQVTGSRLNQLVDSSVLLVGAITDQPSITANTLESTDTTIVNDAGSLKEATIGDILNSNLPITTSSITGGAGVDIVVTPAATRKLDVAGAFEAESINSVGNTTIGGTLTVTGASTHTGATTLTGGISGDVTISGLATASTVPTAGGHLTNKTYVDGAVSKTANGYVTMPNGLIIQWGTHLTAMANYNVATITFPIAFPTACFTVQLTARAVTAKSSGASGLENGIKLNGTPTTTNFSVYVNWSGSGAGDTIYPTWIAIGH